MSRKEIIDQILHSTAALENGLKVPAEPPRYIALEKDVFTNTIWAYFGEYLTEIRRALEESETNHVDRVMIHDLDTGQVYVPVWKITEFGEISL